MITALLPNLYQLRLPLPFALNHVNVYLLRDAQGWTVVDTGLHTPAAEAGWQMAFAELDIEPRQIHTIVLTHFHPDHFGMAGWLHERSGARVLLAPREIALAEEVWIHRADHDDPSLRHFLRHGMPTDLVEKVVGAIAALRAATRPHPPLTPMPPGTWLAMGERRFLAIHAPGHSDGQLVFYAPDERLALVGDQVLLKITPHIGIWPESEPDPLRKYLASLAELATLEVDLALPGHGKTITTWAERIAELQTHHHERLTAMLQAVRAGAETAFTVAQQVFAVERFTPHEARFAIAETIAHLELMVADGLIKRHEDDSLVRYTP
ncbi:MBL fold metallo-hydrolase [Chloroflexus sp.]|uniref:MBL fold metallo-hydrolase n=1 Tax=Chloroflexus sp. TaxID=1904827 RepID=UPI00298F0EC2|nr:MBL fold metallo-hydrolase [Chloroflexus sp.]MDW8403539.1 MBL fold metallo-hydrolase [Chloroflexus sp.]